ncbi:MAG: PKD domain-containing protein, partial [Gammaproteobacteria bacterium]|nr:PKD domain-containing protein [Gammaproteobacteria bacterium]
FFASASDSDGTIVSYSWDFGDGASANSTNASHSYTLAGNYTVTLTVTDNDGATATAQTTITVSPLPGNVLPEAFLNLSTWEGEAPLAVDFFASASDSDGTIVSYSWDFGDGASANSTNASHSYTLAGNYTVTLTVTDNDGATATAQTTVTVSPAAANMVPTALFYMTQDSGVAPLDVGFDGAYSTDDDGTVTNYLWNFGDGNSATGANVSHVYTTAGSFTAKLTVTDDKGAQATYDGLIVVEAAAVSPTILIAAFSINPQIPSIKDVVQFSGSASTAPDGNIASYLWDFGDGESANGVNVSHQYSVPGIYTSKLTIWDNYNASSQKSVALTVLSAESRAQELRTHGALDALRFLLLKKKEK